MMPDLPLKGTNSSSATNTQTAGMESTEKTFYRDPSTLHGHIREIFFFPSTMSELIGILENILSTVLSSSDL
jgi:hypothetical protein